MNQRTYGLARKSGFVWLVAAALALTIDYWPTKGVLQWHSLDSARVLARQLNKPVLVDIYADWCGPCRMMERHVFPNDSVREILTTRYVLAKFDVDDPAIPDSIKNGFGLRGIPTYVVLGPTGREWKRSVGYSPPTSFIKWLNDPGRLFIVSWLSFEAARTKAVENNLPNMVLLVRNGGALERANSFFETSNVREYLLAHFTPTLLIQSNPDDREHVEFLRVSDYPISDETGLVLVLSPDGVERGRFLLTYDMWMNESFLLNKLEQLLETKNATLPNFAPSPAR